MPRKNPLLHSHRRDHLQNIGTNYLSLAEIKSWTAVLAGILWLAAPPAHASCNSTLECLNTPPFNEILAESDDGQYLNYNETMYKRICSGWPEVKLCIVDRFEHCKDSTLLTTMDTDDRIFTTICGEGLTEYLKHSSCYHKQTVGDQLHICKVAWVLAIEDLVQKKMAGSITQAQLASQYCRHYVDNLNCSHMAITTHCEVNAADFFILLIQSIREPFLQAFRCGENIDKKVVRREPRNGHVSGGSKSLVNYLLLSDMFILYTVRYFSLY